MAGKKEPAFLTYKEKPLVRNGDMIYYGNMSDSYVILIKIASKKEFEDMEIAEKVTVQLLSTDPNLGPRERIVRRSERRGLYSAIDLGCVWLDMALSDHEKNA